MNELITYYQRLFQVISDDVEHMLTEPDPAKRAPKMIMEYLKLATQCQEQISQLSAQDSLQNEWSKLSAEALEKIDEIIKQDLRITKNG